MAMSTPSLLVAGAIPCLAAWLLWGSGEQRSTDLDAPTGAGVSSLTPEETLATFVVPQGYRVELVASEPSLAAPVHAAFDADGALWVVEMRAFMKDVWGRDELAQEGRVVRLVDGDDDGSFESATTFLDGLVLPRSVLPCFDGALVLAPPDLLFARDRDGDGRADDVRVVASGFDGLDNPEHAPNALTWGLDGVIHLAQSRREFTFDGERVVERAVPSIGQWGLTFDDGGRLYTTPNSTALLADLVPKRYGARNGRIDSIAGLGVSIGTSNAVRPAFANPAVNRGYQAGVLGADGKLAQLTAACSPVVDRTAWFASESPGSVFLCEPAGNLVKQLVLEHTDGRLRAVDPRTSGEFLTSTDPRFRPVALTFGPDAALYVVDFGRGVLQHANFITPYLRDQTTARGLERPLERGRIFRVVRDVPVGPREWPRLSRASDLELVRVLEHEQGWWRDTAARLLVERGARVDDALRFVLEASPVRGARIASLHTLARLGRLGPADVLRALDDPWDAQRRAALELAEPWLADHADLRARVERSTSSASREERVAALLALGAQTGTRAFHAFTRALDQSGDDALVRGAVLSGLQDRELAFLRHTFDDPSWPRSQGETALARELVQAALRRPDLTRFATLEWCGELALAWDARAALVFDRIAATLALDEEHPRTLELPSRPRTFERAATQRVAYAQALMQCDWPGRPAVVRKPPLRPLSDTERRLFDRGERIYSTCHACHQGDGRGSPGLAPPLAGSTRVTGPAASAIRIVMHGLEGRYRFGEAEYAGTMPPVPLSEDHEIAAVLTYVRRSFGNRADPVSPADVTRERERTRGRDRPWTPEELETMR
ncbi:MAG: c-type cytochrome [Planctomycetes bacterium]|nr:c-type cytochrome [Planctomycetota bacterium]